MHTPQQLEHPGTDTGGPSGPGLHGDPQEAPPHRPTRRLDPAYPEGPAATAAALPGGCALSPRPARSLPGAMPRTFALRRRCQATAGAGSPGGAATRWPPRASAAPEPGGGAKMAAGAAVRGREVAALGTRPAAQSSRGVRADGRGPHRAVGGHRIWYENKEGSGVMWGKLAHFSTIKALCQFLPHAQDY